MAKVFNSRSTAIEPDARPGLKWLTVAALAVCVGGCNSTQRDWQQARTMASLVGALFFVRYWRVSGERLFAFFAVAFGLLAANWFALASTAPAFEARPLIYIIRLAAFILIALAIADKNRSLR